MTVTTAELTAAGPAQLGAEKFCDLLFDYLETTGQTMYDKTVTQLGHGLQCAFLAESEDQPAELQVAALLHDIGHLMLDEHDQNSDFLDTDLRHEIVGAHVLGRWFGQSVAGPVALHVPAKRYLVATDPTYRDGLSESSIRSLAVQGGPMTAEEAAAFEKLPHAAEAVAVRRWDDLGKAPNLAVPPLEHWRSAVVTLLEGQQQ